MFDELNVEPKVDFIDMPETLRGKYQYYTCADMNKLHAAGFDQSVTTLEKGLRTYISDFLEAEDRYR
jgi:ADP-L-glycero-D-manno-heptose 6-epimerase